ncbi:unnamed protein product, partial [Schistosoma turkestanicum]
VYDLFLKLKGTIIHSLSSKSWTSADKRNSAIDMIRKTEYSAINMDNFNTQIKAFYEIIDK